MVLLLAACGQPAVSDAARDDADTAPSGEPWITGEVQNKSTVEPVTTDCVSEADLDPNGSVSSDDPPVCNPNPDTYGTLMVEGSTADSPDPMPAAVHVAKTVPIERRKGGAAAWDDLARGSKVSVWITGEIAESYPPQVRATKIVIDS